MPDEGLGHSGTSTAVRNGLHVFDLLVLREAPDADVALSQVAVGVPVERAGGALVDDVAAIGQRLKSLGDSLGPGDGELARGPRRWCAVGRG